MEVSIMQEVRPAKAFEECVTAFFIRCADIGLDCDCIISGNNVNNVVKSTIVHMYEYHAVKPEEMTTDMKLKIFENIHYSIYSSKMKPIDMNWPTAIMI